VDEILERTQWDTFWLPPDAAVVDRPELMYLSTPRDTATLNSVLRVRAGAERLPALVGEVSAAHAGRPSRWALTPQWPRDALEPLLADAGYAVEHEHYGYALEVSGYRPGGRAGVCARPAADRQGLLDWLRVSGLAFGSSLYATASEAELDSYLDACTRPGARVHRVVAYDEATGEPLSAGGLTAFPELRFGFLWAGGTAPEARGRGAYSAVLAGRIAWAAAQGLTHVGLYARVDTSAPIVHRQGFTRYGRMSFWGRLPVTAG
jgi:hypothetical protein